MATKPVPNKADAVEPPKSEQPVVIAKPVPTDELGATLDQFFATFQSSGLKTMKTILGQFKEKADAVITKLDVDGDTPKKG